MTATDDDENDTTHPLLVFSNHPESPISTTTITATKTTTTTTTTATNMTSTKRRRDSGRPTFDILTDTERLFALMDEARYFTAHTLYTHVHQRIETHWRNNRNTTTTTTAATARITTPITATEPTSHHHANNNHSNSNYNNRSFNGNGLSRSQYKRVRIASQRVSGEESERLDEDEDEDEGKNEEDRMYMRAQELLNGRSDDIKRLEKWQRLFRQTQRNLARDDDDDDDPDHQKDDSEEKWIHAHQHLGVHTYYKQRKRGTTDQDQSLSIKVEGMLENHDVSLFDQVCVLREVDLHATWAPFCVSARTIQHISAIDQVGMCVLGWTTPNLSGLGWGSTGNGSGFGFGFTREACFRAVGCDNTDEDGTILMTVQSVQLNNDHDDVKDAVSLDDDQEHILSHDPIVQQLNLPPSSIQQQKRRGYGEMTIHRVDARIEVLSPMSAKIKILAHINPHITDMVPMIAPMRHVLLDFIVKHMAGVVLAKLQGAARKISRHPQSNVHAKRMRADPAFYKDWLLVQFNAYCQEKGWPMPAVPALSYTSRMDNHEHETHATHLRRPLDFRRVRTHSGCARSHSHFWSQDRTDSDELSDLSSVVRHGRGEASSSQHASSYFRRLFRLRSSITDDEHNNHPHHASISTSKKNDKKSNKAARIAADRDRAAERLKPTPLPVHQQKRLRELKDAIQARKQQLVTTYCTRSMSRASFDFAQSTMTFSEVVTDRLHAQGRVSRMLVLAVLVMLLFFMLHPGTFIQFPSQRMWSAALAQDILVVAYIFLCSVVHFVLCDVALVFAFSSLDLGQKAGREIKLFYSVKVRYAVAGGSLFIVAVSIVHAVSKLWSRALLRTSIYVLSMIRQFIIAWAYATANKSSPVSTHHLYYFFQSCIHYINSWLTLVIASIYRTVMIIVRSTVLLRETDLLVRSFIFVIGHLVQILLDQGKAFIQDEDGDFVQGKSQTIRPWKEDAIRVARSLFLYSAVFLVTMLGLFYCSARRAARPYRRGHDGAEGSPVDDNDEKSMMEVMGSGMNSSSSFRQQCAENPDHDPQLPLPQRASSSDTTTMTTEHLLLPQSLHRSSRDRLDPTTVFASSSSSSLLLHPVYENQVLHLLSTLSKENDPDVGRGREVVVDEDSSSVASSAWIKNYENKRSRRNMILRPRRLRAWSAPESDGQLLRSGNTTR